MDALKHLQSTSYLSKLTKQYQNGTYFLEVSEGLVQQMHIYREATYICYELEQITGHKFTR
jgi:hypothetical protein